MKEHDWIVAGLNNPNFTPDNFRGIGMYLDNTLLLSKEDYLKSDYIKNHDAFKDNYGNFSLSKFETFYNNKVLEFENFKTVDDVIYYDLYDVNRMDDPKGKVKDPSFILYRVSNPNLITIGVGGINKKEESPFSARELAQLQNIFNSETGNFENYTPNDMSFTEDPIKWLKNIIQEPLVLATYDLDTIDYDPISGEQVLYKKGLKKLNDLGQYYYETLNGRSTHGKEVLSSFDILTTDGVGLNKYDFFDSDGLDKSVTGVIAKSAAAIAPLLIGGPVGSIYAGIMVARELIKVLPMIDGIVGGITGNDEDSLLSKTLYDWAAYGHKFSTSLSDYGKGLLTFEGLSNLLVDVALQYGLQQFIAKSWRKLKSFDKIQDRAEESAKALYEAQRIPTIRTLESQGLDERSINSIVGSIDNWKNSALGASILKDLLNNVLNYAQVINRAGADLSLAYMALISNGDVYESMLSYGTTKREAISVALGSTLGMFFVNRKLGLDTLFYDDVTAPKIKAIRAGLKLKSKEWGAEFVDLKNNIKNLNLSVPEKIKYYINFGRDKAANLISDYADDLLYHTTNFYGKAFGEGLEEMSEEFVSDISKQLYELASVFGFDTTTDNVNAFENVWADSSKWGALFTKYGSQFLGGLMGGGLFYGVEVFKHGKFKRDDSLDELIYLVRNNRTKDVLRHLDSMHKKGKLGSTVLSSEFVITDGEKHFLTADKNRESQNDFIYKRLREEILGIDAIIRENSLNLSEESLYSKMTFDEHRFQLLEQELKDISYQTGYLERYLDLVNKIVENDREIKRVLNQTPDSADNTEIIEKLLLKKKDLLKELEEFNSGETAIDYLGEMTFLMDARLNDPFFNASFPQWLRDKKKVEDYSKLNDTELEAYRSEYLEAVRANYKRDAKLAWEGFKELRKEISPELMDIEDRVREYSEWMEITHKIFDNDGPFAKMIVYDYDTKLDNETDDDYNFRNKKREGEDDTDYIHRILNRLKLIEEKQKEERKAVFDKVRELIDDAGGYLDSVSKRRILINLPAKKSEILRRVVLKLGFGEIKGLSTRTINNINNLLSSLKDDLSNKDEVYDSVQDLIERDVKNTIDEIASNRIRALGKYRGTTIRKSEKDTALNEILVKLLNDIHSELIDRGIDTQNSSLEKDDIIYTAIQSIKTDSDELTFTENNILEFINKLTNFDFSSFNTLVSTYEDILNIDESKLTPAEKISVKKDKIQAYQNILTSLFSYEDITTLTDLLVTRNGLHTFEYIFSEDLAKLQTINDILEDSRISPLILFENKFNLLEDDLDADEIYDFIKYLENLPVRKNPITDIIKKLALKTNKDYTNIESLLNKIEERLLSDGTESLSDFQLTILEEDALTEAEILLNQVFSFIYASYNSENFENPFMHNALMNNIAERNEIKNWEKLSVIGDDVANLYLSQILNYLLEIGLSDGDSFTQGSWRWKSQINAANVATRFLEADVRFAEAKLNFFQINRNIFRSTDSSIDLLKGYESLPPNTDPQINVYNIENLLYKNVREIMSSKGLTLSDILTKTGISQLIVGNEEDILFQKTCLLNEHVTYDKLTAFDKFMYVLGTICTSAQDMQRICKQFIKINGRYAPLLTQEHDVRLALSLVLTEKGGEKSLNLYKQGMTWLYKKLPAPPSGKENPLLMSNAITLLGNGGAGKTDVCIRMIGLNLNSDEIWVSGPKDKHVSNLASVTGSANKFNKEELFTKLLGKTLWDEIVSELAKLQAAKPGDSVTVKADLFKKVNMRVGSNITYIFNSDKSAGKISKLSNPPKLLVIDEASHFSNYELSILLYIADFNDFGLILVGDEYLNGYSNGYLENLDTDSIFCGRTNRLYLSLRPGNILKYRNTQILSQWLHRAYTANATQSRDAAFKLTVSKIIDDFSKIQLDYYNGSTINGDFVTNKITSDVLDKLSGSICFIGDQNSITYRELCAKFGKDSIFIDSEENVQGSEYDFVVIDKDWKSLWSNYNELLKHTAPANKHTLLYDVTLIAKSLYTLSTRGKTAAIFIDNGLSTFIKFNKDSVKANVNILNQSVIDRFKQNKLNFLLKLNLEDDIEINRTVDDEAPLEERVPVPTPSHTETPEKEDDDDDEDGKEDGEEDGKGSTPESNEEDSTSNEDEDETEGNEDEDEGKDEDEDEDVPSAKIISLSSFNINDLNFNENKYFLLKVENNLKRAYNTTLTSLLNLSEIFGNTSIEDIRIFLNEKQGIIYEVPNLLYNATGENTRVNKQHVYKCIVDSNADVPPPDILGIDYEEADKNLNNINTLDQDQVLLDLANSIKSTMVRTYVESHLSGFRRTKDNDKYIWETDSDSDLVKDCVNFLTDDEKNDLESKGDITIADGKIIINSGKVKALLVHRLLLAKSFLMYTNGDFEELQPYLGADLNAWKDNITYKVIVEPKQDSDNFVGYSGLDEDLMEIKESYTYKLVAEWKSLDNKTRRITLSLLANPERLTDTALDSIRDGIQKRMRSLAKQPDGTSTELYKNLLQQLDNLPTLKTNYNNDLDILKDEANNNGGSYELVISLEDLNILLNSAIRNITSSGNNVQSRRLSSLMYRSRKAFDPDDKITSWQIANPYVVMSSVYGYRTDTSSPSSKIHDDGADLGGKCVIFASRNLGLSPEDLLDTWISERNSDKHSVRMLLLDNIGVDFKQLTSEELHKAEILQTQSRNGQINYFPYETKYMAYRQLVALWNFRANLDMFITRVFLLLREWNGKISESELDNLLLRLANLLHEFSESKKNNENENLTFENYLSSTVSQDELIKLKLIIDFNNSLHDRQRMFRLGRGMTKDFMIRRLTNISSDNSFYKDVRFPKGIYLTYEKAQKFYDQIDLIINTFLSPVYGSDFKFRREDGSGLNKIHEVSLSKDGKIKGFFPAHISNLESFSVTLPDGTKVDMPKPGDIRYLPSMLVELYKSASAYQHKKNDDDWNWENLLKKFSYTVNSSTNSTEEKRIFGLTNEGNSVLKLIEDGWEITDLLNLCMFGTVEDFIDKKLSGNRVDLATGVLFPDGFLSDPLFVQERGNEIYDSQNRIMGSFVQVLSNKALFKLTGALDFGYIYIDLRNAYNRQNNKNNQESIENLKEDVRLPNQDLSTDDTISLLKYLNNATNGPLDLTDDQIKSDLINLLNSILNDDLSDKELSAIKINNQLTITYDRNTTYEFNILSDRLEQIVNNNDEDQTQKNALLIKDKLDVLNGILKNEKYVENLLKKRVLNAFKGAIINMKKKVEFDPDDINKIVKTLLNAHVNKDIINEINSKCL